jgi:c-di-GMP-binding flagellar brake protein YcgR
MGDAGWEMQDAWIRPGRFNEQSTKITMSYRNLEIWQLARESISNFIASVEREHRSER